MAKTDKKVLGRAKTNQTPDAQKQKMRKERNLVKSGVVYIKHIPHGFYEDEMKGFFSQFGKVLRVCVARSDKTGNSKGFGYVQFVEDEVAKIAAETMNNYLMFEKILKCKVLPADQVTAATFGNASRRTGHNCPAQKRTDRAVELLSVRKGTSQKKNSQKRREAAQRRTMLRLAQLGIKYDLSGGLVQEIEPVPAPAGDKSANSTADSTQLPALEMDETLEMDESGDDVESDDDVESGDDDESDDDDESASTPQAPTPVRSNSATPTPVRSNPATPTPVRSNPATPVPVRSNPATPVPVRSNPATPAASKPKTATPKSAAKATARSPKTATTPVTPKSSVKNTTTTPNTPKSLAKKTATTPFTPKSSSNKIANTPKTPKSSAKKTPPVSARLRSARKKTVVDKKTPPKSGRKR